MKFQCVIVANTEQTSLNLRESSFYISEEATQVLTAGALQLISQLFIPSAFNFRVKGRIEIWKSHDQMNEKSSAQWFCFYRGPIKKIYKGESKPDYDQTKS